MKLKKNLSVMITTLILLGCAHNNSGDNAINRLTKQIAQINKVVAEARKQYGLSAILFGVWEGERELVTGALGSSTKDVPANKQMNFRTGGVNEMVMTTILLKLIEEKRYGISLDDTIDKWFPNFPYSQQVTLRMLGNSTSGYVDFLTLKEIVDDKDFFTKEWDPVVLAEAAVAQPILFEPGTQFKYSHTNFSILGLVLEKITDKNLHLLVEEYISGPLHLNNTQDSTSSQIPSPALHSYLTQHGVFQDATNFSPTWAGTSGLMTSNLADLGKWLTAFGRGTLLSTESYQELTKEISAKSPKLSFALGFVVSNSWFFQNPSINGYKSVAAYLKPKDISLVITTTDGIKSDSDTHYAQLIFPKIVQILAPEYSISPNP